MDLVRLINHPELMNKETLYELRNLVALYPYYQTARILMLRNMYLLHDSAFDDELRRTALYVTDRSMLFKLVESAHYEFKNPNEVAADNMETSADDDNRTISIINNFLDSAPQQDQPDEPKHKPTPADGLHCSSGSTCFVGPTARQNGKRCHAVIRSVPCRSGRVKHNGIRHCSAFRH